MDIESFDYDAAFNRNLGLVQPLEQEKLKNSRVAIAGLGGVGGIHALTLTRMGIGKFHIADFDTFEIHNFNRQSGAAFSTIGKEKCSTLQQMMNDINPSAKITTFDAGINENNINQFLENVDVVVDGLDSFAVATGEMR